MRFIGRRDGVSERAARADGLGRGARPRGNDAHHAVRRLQLRRARGDPRRGRALHRRRRGRRSAPALRARDARPRPVIRTSGEQRLSNYLLWQSAYSELVFARRAVAGLHARGVRARRWTSTRAARAALRGPLMAARGPRRPGAAAARRARAPRRGGVGPRRAHPRRDPGDRLRDLIVWQGGLVFAFGADPARARLPARALRDVRPRAPGRAWPGFARRSSGCSLAAHYGDRYDLLLARGAGPADVRLTVLQPRGGAPAVSVTLLGIVWIGLALAHAVLLRDLPHGDGHPRRRARRHVPGRHRRLPRRPRVRRARRWRRGSRRTRPSRASSSGSSSAVAAVVVRGPLPGLALAAREALLLGVGVALAAPLGDLFECYLKRDAGHEGHRHAVRRPRRRAGPPRRRAVHRRRRLLRLGGDG